MNLNTIAITELEIINNYNNQSMVGTATSIDAQDLEIITPMGTQEILERVPGINGFSDDGIGNSRINVGIRGINPRRSSRVLILEDGVPYNLRFMYILTCTTIPHQKELVRLRL